AYTVMLFSLTGKTEISHVFRIHSIQSITPFIFCSPFKKFRIMRKIISSAIMLLITGMAYAQPHAVTINNNASCDVYIVFYGDKAPGCGTGYRSLITITAPGSFT